MTTASGETTTVAGTRAFVDAMIAHNTQVRAEIEQAAASLAAGGLTGPVLDGLHELAGHYGGARLRWDGLGAALKQHEALAERARATAGAATDMTFYTDDSVKEAMTASSSPTGGDAGRATDNRFGPGDGALPDAAGIDSPYWHGSDVVTGAGDGKVVLGVVCYTDGEQPSDAYVAVATTTDPLWDPDSTASGIIPQLSPAEANRLADELDVLAALAETGTPVPPPTELDKLADRIRGLAGDAGVTIAGDQGDTEVPATLLRQLLDAAAPPPAVATRRKVTATDCGKDQMDDGTVWAELDTTGAAPVVAVTSTEGTEQPEDYPGGYTTTRLPPADAKVLADKLRRFAEAAPAAGQTQDQPTPAAAPAAAGDARRLRNARGQQIEYDPGTGRTAVIERDGWRATVPATSPTGVAAWLLHSNEEIKAGRGSDLTEQDARVRLDQLSVGELRQLADETGASIRGARTKSQMIDAVVAMMISSPRGRQ
jgi:hypothetical protein